VLRYEQETALLFEARFASQVRGIRAMFSLRGLTDRDMDAFHRRPANAFQIGVIAQTGRAGTPPPTNLRQTDGTA
jgi:hypothetical protein